LAAWSVKGSSRLASVFVLTGTLFRIESGNWPERHGHHDDARPLAVRSALRGDADRQKHLTPIYSLFLLPLSAQHLCRKPHLLETGDGTAHMTEGGMEEGRRRSKTPFRIPFCGPLRQPRENDKSFGWRGLEESSDARRPLRAKADGEPRNGFFIPQGAAPVWRGFPPVPLQELGQEEQPGVRPSRDNESGRQELPPRRPSPPES